MHDIDAFISIYIGKHLSTGFEAAVSLPYVINAYRKGKSRSDLTLDRILTLEDIN